MATHSGSDQQESPLSFFKVIRYPSSGHLSLPNAFVRRYIEKIPKHPTLVTATRDHSWTVEFVKIGEDYCFAHGWDALVKDVGLCSRDVVVFWLIDSRTFLVSFLGANGCEKYVPVNKTNVNDDDVMDDDDDDDDDDDVMDDDDEDEDTQDKNLSFKKDISRGSLRYMLLPIKFVKAAGLERKESVDLKDHEGKEWPMRIASYESGSIKYCLSAGWAHFRNYHKLSVGDACTFTFDKQGGVINLTQVLKSKRTIKQEIPMEEVNRNTGTQSCYGNGKVKIEDQCSPTEKPCSGGVKVKTEYELDPEIEVADRNREGSRFKGCAEVKIEEGWVPETVVGKRKRDMGPPERPSSGGGVEVNAERRTESVFRSKRVVYF